MNLIGLAFGRGKRAKLARHGFERSWNERDEPIVRLFGGGYYKRSRRSINFREQRYKERSSLTDE